MHVSRSAFWNSVVTVLLGAAGAQLLPMLAAPLLTRLCTPAELGGFSVWLGVVAVTSIAATLRIDTAMVVEHDRRRQRLCFGIVVYSATAVALALTLLAGVAWLLDLPPPRAMSCFALLTIGAGTWLTACMQTMLAYAAAQERFGKAARAKILQAGAIAASQLALLYAGLDGGALLAGQLIGLGAGLWAGRRLLSPPAARLRLALDREQRACLARHQAFWRFSLPSSLLNAVTGQLPLFMIGIHHGVAAAGLFALAQRVLAAPVSLVAASVLDVFKRQAVREFQSVGNCRGAYRTAFRALLLLAVLPTLVLLLFAPPLFAWLFGPGWRPAGELARILAPLCFLNFVASPLSYVFFVVGKQKMELAWQLALFLVTLVAFSAPLSFHQGILGYAAGRCLLYLVYLYLSHQYSLRGRAFA
ncbi:lipopolysaccharide biosynthesis protein [uncultured Massilia sp.]|uniref:lipopolysaccharide biosynthesis protein n=1 Tax=uncultured Massilia sp. TaxID=169973 RepID=UPI0025EC7F8B|nr:lipopolysaccharide biosynthesis protein [uncultured Massilia sp.]